MLKKSTAQRPAERADLPALIQGGMGVGVSDWRLARAVSQAGQLGVVSGTALDSVLVRRLQLGDHDGSTRRALDAYPVPGVSERILDKYFVAGGKEADAAFKSTSMKRDRPSRDLEDLLIVANFVEVFLAKEGHDGLVGINYLEKIQAPTLPSLYGAMVAGVDFVLMGAGIPKAIPAVLDELAAGNPVGLPIEVKGAADGDGPECRLDPSAAMRSHRPQVRRPSFLAIVSSHVLAVMLATKIKVPVDGFVVEGPTAGGHNAPPRGKLQLDPVGQPVYGTRDAPDLATIKDLGLPFWLAGGCGTREQLNNAVSAGAVGIQVGTAFAFCEESGLRRDIKEKVLESSRNQTVEVFTDPKASPSGFPFKVVEIKGTLSDSSTYDSRPRQRCDLGYLRTAHSDGDGKVTWRCPSEPVADYVRKGGDAAATVGKKCLCNALLADIGLGQVRAESEEPVLVTAGDGVADISQFLKPGSSSYRAIDVISKILPDVLTGANDDQHHGN